MNKKFSLGDILSITIGRLVSQDGMDGIYNILNHMTNSDLSTIELLKASDQCQPVLDSLYPQLSKTALSQDIKDLDDQLNKLDSSKSQDQNNELRNIMIQNWIKSLEEKLGNSFDVPQLQDLVQDKLVKNNVSNSLNFFREPNLHVKNFEHEQVETLMNKDITPLMYAVINNKNLNLNQAQIRHLVKYCDTNNPVLEHYKPLLDALNNKNLNLNQEQLTDLIQQDLKQPNIYHDHDRYDWYLLIDAFSNNNDQNLNQKIYNSFNEEQKQEFFNAFSDAYLVFKDKYSYKVAINTMLYNFKFQPNEETINYLKENKNQEIIQMINEIPTNNVAKLVAEMRDNYLTNDDFVINGFIVNTIRPKDKFTVI